MSVLDAPTRADAAEQLWAAEQSASPIPPLAQTYPDINVTDAYHIQLRNIARKVRSGSAVAGHKVGLSSPVMQKMMGVDEPDYGHLLIDMAIGDGETVDLAGFCAPRIEVEIGFILGASLPQRGCTEAHVLAATEYVCAAIELIDSRILDWNIGITDTIADNASSARYALGREQHSPVRLNLADIDAVLYSGRTGRESVVTAGNSAAVLGNPATAVAWLANTVSAFGVRLEAGHVILPGSCTRAIDVAAGDRYRAAFAGIGSVSVNFVNSGS
jgi:2-keto-4-pentenoate hydratase